MPADPYEQAQFAGIAHLLAIAREQASAPATLPLPRYVVPADGDQIALLEAEAAVFVTGSGGSTTLPFRSR